MSYYVAYFETLHKNKYVYMYQQCDLVLHLLSCCDIHGFTKHHSFLSSMAVPVSMQCLSRCGIHPSVIRFMIPIGATVNMDGFALYEAMSCIFIATLNGMNPGPAQVITLG